MNLIDKADVTTQADVEEWSPREAFAALLIAGARSDGTVSAQEANGIEHVIAGMKLFSRCWPRGASTDDRQDHTAYRESRR